MDFPILPTPTSVDGGGSYVTNFLSQQTTFDGQTVSHNVNGDVTTAFGGASSYSYDAQNRLTSVSTGGVTTNFNYDGLNRKISQTVGGATTYNVWDGWSLIEERGAGNALLNTYVYGAGEIIERITGANTYFYYQDGLGSTSHLADAGGNLLESYRYGTFGQFSVHAPNGSVRKNGSDYDIRHLFTGQLWMPQTGLYDYRNRVFSPSLTRFLQPDPIGFAGDPSNLYRYCGNNSVNWTDPSGLDGNGPRPGGKPKPPKLPRDSNNFGNSSNPNAPRSTRGWWKTPGGFATGTAGSGGSSGQGGGRSGGMTVGFIGITQHFVVTSSAIPDTNPPDLGSPFFGFQPGEISFGVNLASSAPISLWTPGPVGAIGVALIISSQPIIPYRWVHPRAVTMPGSAGGTSPASLLGRQFIPGKFEIGSRGAAWFGTRSIGAAVGRFVVPGVGWGMLAVNSANLALWATSQPAWIEVNNAHFAATGHSLFEGPKY